MAKEISRLDIGQTVVVKKGTVLAVEGFEGTDECIQRGGALDAGRHRRVERRGREILRQALRVFAGVVVDPALGADLDDAHREAIHHAHRQLAAENALLHQPGTAGNLRQRGRQLRLGTRERPDRRRVLSGCPLLDGLAGNPVVSGQVHGQLDRRNRRDLPRP